MPNEYKPTLMSRAAVDPRLPQQTQVELSMQAQLAQAFLAAAQRGDLFQDVGENSQQMTRPDLTNPLAPQG